MTTKIKVPKYEDFPEYAVEAGKMVKLKESHEILKAKRTEMSRVNSEHTAAIRLRGENIDELIEAGEFSETSTGARFDTDDFAQINSQIHMLEQAIAKHQVTLDKTKNLVHPKMLKGIRTKYGSLVKKIATAYIEIAKLHEEENDITSALDNADIRYWGVMPKLHTSNIGFPSNEYAWIHFFFREAEQQGYLKAKDYLK